MGAWNRLVVGDNLAVLPRLQPGFDLAYLDPPYNTGNAFAYADDRRGAGGADRHRAWTDWLRPRLEAVRDLMSPRGVVVASIDDHEVAHLRLLLDEVLGESGFVAQIVVNLNPKGRQLGGGFATSHEYLLVYAVDPRACALDPTSAESVDPADFPRVSEDGRRHRLLPLRNTNKRFNPATAPTLHYPLWGDPLSGAVATAPFGDAERIEPVFGDGRPAVWRWSAALVDQRTDDLVCRTVRGRLGERVDVYQRDWLHPGRRKKLTTIWLAEEIGSTDSAIAELKDLLGHVFETPKPTPMLRRLLSMLPDDARVLDPFAGSGALGHAVALANAADGARRTCTSVELDEPTRPGSLAALAGYRALADITRARLRAVAERVGGGFEEG